MTSIGASPVSYLCPTALELVAILTPPDPSIYTVSVITVSFTDYLKLI
jgi:hypothetical protein